MDKVKANILAEGGRIIGEQEMRDESVVGDNELEYEEEVLRKLDSGELKVIHTGALDKQRVKASKQWRLNMPKYAADVISSSIAKSINFQEMSNFQNKYTAIVDTYLKTPYLAVLSTIKLEELGVFQDWLDEIQKTKSIAVPLLISKMLRGDIFALNVYDNLYKDAANLLVSYGVAEDGRAIASAEHWLSSEEAVEVLGTSDSGKIALCSANQMLGVTNGFIEC